MWGTLANVQVDRRWGCLQLHSRTSGCSLVYIQQTCIQIIEIQKRKKNRTHIRHVQVANKTPHSIFNLQGKLFYSRDNYKMERSTEKRTSQMCTSFLYKNSIRIWLMIALFPGPSEGGENGPGFHCSRMDLIIYNQSTYS